jgi:hypothetical protein
VSDTLVISAISPRRAVTSSAKCIPVMVTGKAAPVSLRTVATGVMPDTFGGCGVGGSGLGVHVGVWVGVDVGVGVGVGVDVGVGVGVGVDVGVGVGVGVDVGVIVTLCVGVGVRVQVGVGVAGVSDSRIGVGGQGVHAPAVVLSTTMVSCTSVTTISILSIFFSSPMVTPSRILKTAISTNQRLRLTHSSTFLHIFFNLGTDLSGAGVSAMLSPLHQWGHLSLPVRYSSQARGPPFNYQMPLVDQKVKGLDLTNKLAR